MSQIIITGKPQFEDIIELIKLLPESDRVALKNYLQTMDDHNYHENFDQILARFRGHNYSNAEIKEDVESALNEVRSSKRDRG